MPAPVAAAGFAEPLGHALPFFAVGVNGAAGVDFSLDCRGDHTVNDGNDIVAITFGTEWGTGRTFPLFCLATHAILRVV